MAPEDVYELKLGYSISMLLQERFKVNFSLNFSWLTGLWKGQGVLGRWLSILLILAIAGVIGALIYVIDTPRVEENFTEFYILDIDGESEYYPREFLLGETGQVLLGIINREHETTDYRVQILIDGKVLKELEPITLEHEEKWQQEVFFKPVKAGSEQKTEFLLYKGGSAQVYLSLHLWIEVTER